MCFVFVVKPTIVRENYGTHVVAMEWNVAGLIQQFRVVYDQCFCCCFRYGRALYFQRKRRDSVSQLRLLVDDGSNDLKIWLVVDLKFLHPAKSASTHHNVLPRISGFSDILPVDTIMVIITYSWNRCCDLVNRQSFP